MTGPEEIHRRLTSGNPGTIAGLAGDLRSAVRDLGRSVGDIEYTGSIPNWSSPDARARFDMNAWATRAMVQVAQVRTDRAKLAVQRVQADYTWVGTEADRILQWWREQKQVWKGVPFVYTLVLQAATSAMDDLAEQYGEKLTEAITLFDNAELDDYQQAWLGMGLLKLMRFDLNDPTDVGPPIPDTLLGGDDDNGLAPQGLAVDGDGNLLQTSYNDDGDSVLSVIDPDTGEVLNTVNLGEAEVTDDDKPVTQAPDHAGGVMVDGDTVYVTSSTQPPTLYEYSMDDIRNAAPGDPVPEQSGSPPPIAAGAYATINDGVMYVGTHDKDGEGAVQRYVKDPDGTWQEHGDPFPAPQYTQGIAVNDGVVYFTSSLGRGNDPGESTLSSYDLQTGEQLGSHPLPNMAEGLAATDDGLAVTYESGSSMYDEQAGNPFDSLFPSPNLTVTPYGHVGPGTIEVETLTLREASRLFRQAEADIDATRARIDVLSLPSSALGEVPEAATFASDLISHLDETATWLRNGNITADITATGLVGAADAYDESDASSQEDFERLLGVIE